MTYFKYAEKNANSRINWADVGADMSAMISEEARVREEKKSAIDKDIREFRQVLFDSPIGENKGFNEFTSDFSSDAQEYSLVVEKLFRTGQMNQREYNTIKANLKQGTSEAFTIAEEYNAHYKLARERGEIDPKTGHPTSQSYEEWVLNGTLGFMNYSDNRLWINPVNGMVSMGGSTLNSETGEREMNTDIGSYESVNALRNRTQAQYNYFDMDSSNSKMVKQLGDVITVEMKKNVSTREDATKSPKVMEAIDNHASATLALPTNISSVLTNSININPNTGNAFTFTSDPLEAARNPDLILSIPNPIQQGSGIPSPAFLGSGEALTKYLNENFKDLSYKDDKGETVSHSEVVAQIVANNTEQYDVAKDVVTTSMVSMLNKKETAMTQFNNQQYYDGKGEKRKSAASSVKRIADIHNGTESEFDAALPFVQGLDPKVNRIYINPDNTNEVLIDRVDTDGNIITLEPFLKGDNTVDFVTSIYTTLGLDENLLDQALLDSKIAERTNPASTFTGAAGDSRTRSITQIPNFDDPLPNDESDYPRLVSDVHNEAFGTDKNAKAYSNAELEFFSTVGIENAEIKTLEEDDIQQYISGSRAADFNDNSATQLFIPGVMTMPIVIPDNNTKLEFEAINRLILTAKRNGTLLIPNDFEGVFSDFEYYNNKEMADKVLGIQWNNGDGPQPLTDGQVDAAVTDKNATKKRSIAQIMEEDNLIRVEAIKIFNAQ